MIGSLRLQIFQGIRAIALAVAGLATLATPSLALCVADLPAVVGAIAHHPAMARARLGIYIATLEGEVLYDREGDLLFVPASTLKLLTTAAALTHLGPDYRIATTVHGQGAGGRWSQLRVMGAGDPSLGPEALAALADQIQAQGHTIEVLIGDESRLPGAGVSRHWEWEDVQAGYGAAANALIWNGNALRFTLIPQQEGEPLALEWENPALGALWTVENRSRTVASGMPEFLSLGRDLGRPVLRLGGQLVAGSEPANTAIADPTPAETFITTLGQYLTERGLTVGATAITSVGEPGLPPPMATVTSPPLAQLLIPANQNSNNLYAEALLHQLGRVGLAQGGAIAPGIGVPEAGITLVQEYLVSQGIDPDTLVMVDGSGLARKNLVTPGTLVAVLQAMARSPLATPYRDSLAVAGVSGTLSRRFQDTPAAGQIVGKTGTLSRNFALAGYVTPPDYAPLAFAVLINNLDQGGATARQFLDSLVAPLAELTSCP